ncbi:thiol-disulfide oxidoreductase DCC family protein [Variovorax boronicumulans]|uniref:thiol-disulfide oxidoreductase DCC family protein n=1 Tax=Variovorax boronicumulans TaxID=436515 RepID=UPI00339644A4
MTAYPLTVYYDATCPLCVAEMGAMKARDADGRLDLVDCSPAGFSGGPAPRQSLMTAMHTVDAEGRVLSGVAAIRACRAAVGQPSGGLLLDLPVVGALADRAYAVLARNRYRLPRWLVARLAGRGAIAPNTCADDHCRL